MSFSSFRQAMGRFRKAVSENAAAPHGVAPPPDYDTLQYYLYNKPPVFNTDSIHFIENIFNFRFFYRWKLLHYSNG